MLSLWFVRKDATWPDAGSRETRKVNERDVTEQQGAVCKDPGLEVNYINWCKVHTTGYKWY